MVPYSYSLKSLCPKWSQGVKTVVARGRWKVMDQNKTRSPRECMPGVTEHVPERRSSVKVAMSPELVYTRSFLLSGGLWVLTSTGKIRGDFTRKAAPCAPVWPEGWAMIQGGWAGQLTIY
jgi:hypothetical protein